MNITTSSKKPSNFPIWLYNQLAKETNNYRTNSPFSQDQINIISEWVDAKNPPLDNLTLESAYDIAKKWQIQDLVKQYKTNNVVYKWKDGWRIVELPPSSFSSKTPVGEHITDREIEKELMESREEGIINIYGKENSSFIGENPPSYAKEAGILLYSLRDPTNNPRATMELNFAKENPSKLFITEVFSRDPLVRVNDYDYQHPQAAKIKEFFTYLKNQGYQFGTVDNPDGNEKFTPKSLNAVETEDQFGMPYEMYGIGGSVEQYHDNLKSAYSAGDLGSYWIQGPAENAADNLVSYAEERDELSLLEQALEGYSVKTTDKKGKPITQLRGFNEDAMEFWLDAEIEMQHPYPGDEPNQKDFMTEPDPNQLAIPGLPAPVPTLDKEAYEEAKKEYDAKMEAHEEERDELEKSFEPYVFQNYVYQELQRAKARNEAKKKIQPKAFMKTKIYKTADKELDKKMPDGEALALYVQTLKQYLKDNSNICDEWKDLIEKMPSPRKVRQDLSFQECKILYETLEYLWEKITGQRIIPEKEIVRAPESLKGAYWLLNNGILLAGINHFSIIKQNTALISSLLDISGMTLQEYMSGRPNQLIAYIIRHGGVRLFISQNKNLFCHMSPDTYGKWGKEKIRKLDFKHKAVNLIDSKAPYMGWKSGITVKL